MIVEVSAQQLIFPSKCACCGNVADTYFAIAATKTTGKRVVHQSTNVWNVPYCRACLSHIAWSRRAEAWLKWCVIAGLVLAGLSASVSAWLSAVFIVGFTVLGIHQRTKSMDIARSICGSACACPTPAAFFLGWHGTVNSFNFVSHAYALDFMVANQRKLVNVSGEAANLLNAAGVSPSKGPSQYAQRHRHRH